MRVLFDSSVMAVALLENIAMYKTGVYRYAENLALHLAQNPEVELAFYSALCKRDQDLWERKLLDSEGLKNVHMANFYHPLKSRIDVLKQRLIDASSIKKALIKSSIESYRVMMNMTPRFKGAMEPYDIFFSPYHPLPKSVRNRSRGACFTMIHDLIPLKFPHFFKVDKKGFFDSIFKKARPNHFFIAASEATKADICHYYSIDPDKITVAYGAPQEGLFYPVEDMAAANESLKKYQIKAPYILSLATIEPRKNIMALVDAFIEIIKSQPSLELNLVLSGAKGWGMESLHKK